MTSIDDPLISSPPSPPVSRPDDPGQGGQQVGDRRDGPPGPGRTGRSAPGRASRLGQKWSRLLHVYASMIAFVVILLFAFTGLMLNHPTWTLGSEPSTSVVTGELPVELFGADGSLDYLTLSEFARNDLGARGEVTSFGEALGEASIIYAAPGYTADLRVEIATSDYEFTAEQQGWVAVLNDFHTGTDSGSAGRWMIDVAAVFLIVVSLTGLVLQFFLKKRRRAAYASVAVGGAAVVAVIAAVLI